MIDAPPKFAGPLRRLGAIVYDALLVVALWVVVTVLLVLPYGEAVTDANAPLWYVYRILLAVSAITFFVYFWTRKGRTLGMQAWRLRIEKFDGELPNVRDALLRLVLAAVPWAPGLAMIAVGVQTNQGTMTQVGLALLALVVLNYVSAWWDSERRTGHDRWLKTRIVERT